MRIFIMLVTSNKYRNNNNSYNNNILPKSDDILFINSNNFHSFCSVLIYNIIYTTINSRCLFKQLNNIFTASF